MANDLEKIRVHFPALSGTGIPYYFDSAATACMPAVVRDALHEFYGTVHGNIHRSIHTVAEETTRQYESVREHVAHFIGAAASNEIVFTRGTTDGLNMVAAGWAQRHLVAGDEIVCTIAEHHAHAVLWQQVAQQTGARLKRLPIDAETYTVDITSLEQTITEKTKLVALVYDSNVLGPIWGGRYERLRCVIDQARAVGAVVVLDAAQAVAHIPLYVRDLDCDFLAFSAHKLGGPTGLGVLYIHQRRHEEMNPVQFGGGMIRRITPTMLEWQEMPHRLEAGTPPIAQVIGLGALLDFYETYVDWNILALHEAALCRQLYDALDDIPGVTVVGNRELMLSHGHMVSFFIKEIHAHDFAQYLGTQQCLVRAGDHCAQPLSAVWNGQATLRVSFFMYNSPFDVEYLITRIKKGVANWKDLL